MAIFVIWQWIVTLDSIHNSCNVFCPTTIVTTIINLYGGRTSDKTFSSSQVFFLSFHQLLWQLFFQAQKNTAAFGTTDMGLLLKVKLLWYRQSALIWNVLTLPWHLERFVTLSGVDQPCLRQNGLYLPCWGSTRKFLTLFKRFFWQMDSLSPPSTTRMSAIQSMGTFVVAHLLHWWAHSALSHQIIHSKGHTNYLIMDHGSIPGTT